MKVGLIGVGVVGGALAGYLSDGSFVNKGISVYKYDPTKGYTDDLRECHALFVSVPVPNLAGAQQLGVLEKIVEERVKEAPWRPIFIRSTVLPGTCDYLSERYQGRVFAMPEFLTERTASEDFQKQDIVAGCLGEPEGMMLSWLFEGKKLYLVTNTEAEITKYAHNCFGAVKVNFFNIIANLCEETGSDYQRVKRAVLMSGYINNVHMDVPGPDRKYGFGGKCFPSNVEAFVSFLYRNGYDGAHSLRQVELENEVFRAKEAREYGSRERD